MKTFAHILLIAFFGILMCVAWVLGVLDKRDR